MDNSYFANDRFIQILERIDNGTKTITISKNRNAKILKIEPINYSDAKILAKWDISLIDSVLITSKLGEFNSNSIIINIKAIIRTHNGLVSLSICKDTDDYYYVVYRDMKNKFEYYICDQIEGVYNLLSSIDKK